MSSSSMTCSMCGHSFDPNSHATCQNCPLNKGCSLVCCPQCGYEMIDIQQSKLSRFAARWLQKDKATPAASDSNLAWVPPGQQAKVAGFSKTISADRRAHLQAYGLIPGRVIQVLQHKPVTIVQIEHTELALETDLAREIWVETL